MKIIDKLEVRFENFDEPKELSIFFDEENNFVLIEFAENEYFYQSKRLAEALYGNGKNEGFEEDFGFRIWDELLGFSDDKIDGSSNLYEDINIINRENASNQIFISLEKAYSMLKENE